MPAACGVPILPHCKGRAQLLGLLAPLLILNHRTVNFQTCIL